MIYVFDLMEFQVLAAAKGIEEYYGFPAAVESDREQVFFAVYQLMKSGILKQEDGGLAIQPQVSRFMGQIAGARDVMVIDRGQYLLPRQCVYGSGPGAGEAGSEGTPEDGRVPGAGGFPDNGSRYVCLENSRTNVGAVCLGELTEAELFVQMQDLGQLPGPLLNGDIGAYDFDAYWDSHMPAPLWEKLAEGTGAETEALLEEELVHSVFTLRDNRGGRIKKRMVILGFPLEYCMVLEGPGGISLSRYMQGAAERILKTWWREEI